MSDLERLLNRELRRNRLPVHIRRRQARWLASAIKAEGYPASWPLVPGDPVLNRAALQGAELAIGMVHAVRRISDGIDRFIHARSA